MGVWEASVAKANVGQQWGPTRVIYFKKYNAHFLQNACPGGLRRQNQKYRIITGHCNSLLLRFLSAPFALAHNCQTHCFNLPWQKFNLQFFVNSPHELWRNGLSDGSESESLQPPGTDSEILRSVFKLYVSAWARTCYTYTFAYVYVARLCLCMLASCTAHQHKM